MLLRRDYYNYWRDIFDYIPTLVKANVKFRRKINNYSQYSVNDSSKIYIEILWKY